MESFEVYNDFQSNLVNLFHVVKERPISFLEALELLPLNSREEFQHIKDLLSGKVDFYQYMDEELELGGKYLDPLDFEELKEILSTKAKDTDVNRAVAYYRLIRYSYASGGKAYGCRPITMAGVTLSIFKASARLKNTIIENKDFGDLIEQYDREDTFFYCDPPYFETEGHYDADFKTIDHVRLKELLSSIQGKFLLSYNDCPYIRELYKDFPMMVKVTRLNNLKQRYDAGSTYEELLIANYDISEKISQTEQIQLF